VERTSQRRLQVGSPIFFSAVTENIQSQWPWARVFSTPQLRAARSGSCNSPRIAARRCGCSRWQLRLVTLRSVQACGQQLAHGRDGDAHVTVNLARGLVLRVQTHEQRMHGVVTQPSEQRSTQIRSSLRPGRILRKPASRLSRSRASARHGPFADRPLETALAALAVSARSFRFRRSAIGVEA